MLRRVDVLARHRAANAADPANRVAVRWFFAGPAWPLDGFRLTRELDGRSEILGGDWRLPGARRVTAGGWGIDAQQLEADLKDRGLELSGPPLPSVAAAKKLIPALAFALQQADEDVLYLLLEAVAEIRGHSHARDVKLDTLYWRGDPPPITRIVAMRGGTVDEQRCYRDVIDHYRREANALLIWLATDFGVARFLGLGLEDRLLHPPAALVRYTIEALDGGVPTSCRCDAEPADATWPPPPAALNLSVGTPSVVGYPAFGAFFENAAWKPAMTKTMDKRLVERTALALEPIRTVPTPTAVVAWTRPGETPPADFGQIPLLSHYAATWEVERHAFAAGRADEAEAPDTGEPETFVSCHPGERLADVKGNRFRDGLEIAWGGSPFDGWHRYRVRGFDLFGIAGPYSPSKAIAMRDAVAPRPPAVRLEEEIVAFDVTKAATTRVHLDWSEALELTAPDAVRFHLYQRWSCETYHPLVIESLLSSPNGPPPLLDEFDAVQAQIRVTDPAGQPLSMAALAPLVGGTLFAQGGMEFAVLAASEASALIVQRSAGRAPLNGDAMVRVSVLSLERPTVARVERSPADAARVTLQSQAPLTVRLTDMARHVIVPAVSRIYLHLLGLSFAAAPTTDGNAFALTLDEGAGPVSADMLAALATLSETDLKNWLFDSPALWLPPHETLLALDPPPGFAAGRLHVEASALDCYSNEGGRSKAIAPARNIAKPAPIKLGWVPRIWARDAAEYAETARASITWPAMMGAVRYEVERALESALGLVPASADEALLIEAAAHGEAFERVNDSAPLPRFEDDLPGRAPTRAVYRVRGISAGGVAGDWTVVALVWVPDIRIAPQPVPLGAAPDANRERAIRCSWTQPGPVEGIGFRIDARPVRQGRVRDEDWTEVTALMPGALAPKGAGRYSVTLEDRAPGLWQEYRVIAVRHARDPEDVRGRAIRQIDGKPSAPMRACAEGELRPPEGLRVNLSKDGVVTLRWTNRDSYKAIEIRRWEDGGWEVARVSVPSESEVYVAPERLAIGVTWLFELTAVGHDARPRCGPVVVRREGP